MDQPADFVFDLDGTLSDPLIGIHRSINYALVSAGFAEVPASIVAGLIGAPLEDAIRQFVPDSDEHQVHRFVAKYRERYAHTGFAENSLYDGVPEALVELSRRGLRLGVCTSKRVDFAERILVHFGLREHFCFVDGGDIGITKASQLEALAKAGRVNERSTMIGDRDVDMSAARVNGLSAIGVLWGYGSEDELRKAGAKSILRQTRELSELT